MKSARSTFSSLQQLCDGMRMHVSKLSAIRDATLPARNTFSRANKIRSAARPTEDFLAVSNA